MWGERSLTLVRRADSPHPNPSPEGEGLRPQNHAKVVHLQGRVFSLSRYIAAMRALTLLPLLLLSACGDERETARRPEPREKAAQPPMPELEPPKETAQDREDRGDAAATLKLYYARIGSGDYDSAWAMRSAEAGDEARRRFADNFRAYATYEADVGTPSEPVEAQGWAYVEVPVMIRGTFKGGKPFASAGSVSMRKAVSGPRAGEGWRIYTGDR